MELNKNVTYIHKSDEKCTFKSPEISENRNGRIFLSQK